MSCSAHIRSGQVFLLLNNLDLTNYFSLFPDSLYIVVFAQNVFSSLNGFLCANDLCQIKKLLTCVGESGEVSWGQCYTSDQLATKC